MQTSFLGRLLRYANQSGKNNLKTRTDNLGSKSVRFFTDPDPRIRIRTQRIWLRTLPIS